MTLDQQRWAALKAGQKTALAQIYEHEVDALYRYGRQFTTDAALVEDCIQEMFISLWQNRNTLGTTTAIRPYLLVALRRRIVRKLDQQGRRYASDEISENQMGSDQAVGDGDLIVLDSAFTPQLGTWENASAWPLTFFADSFSYGMETVPYIVCDDATPSLCDTGYIVLDVRYKMYPAHQH